MEAKLSNAISHRQTLHASIDSKLLRTFPSYPQATALTLRANVQEPIRLHILGSSAEPALDGKFCSYWDETSKTALILNLPEGYRFEMLPVGHLTLLDIRFTGLTSLDLSFFHLGDLTRLILDNNPDLRSVSGWDALPRLRQLHIQNTPLENPDALGACTELDTLEAADLELEDPRFLSNLTKLYQLYLCQTRIGRFPDLTGLRRLNTLDLYESALPSMAEAAFPDSLEHLSLSRSSLRQVPDGIQKLKRLRCLDLSGLQLDDLPDWLADLDLPFTISGLIREGIILKDTMIKGIDMSIFDQPQDVIRQWFRERREADRMVSTDEVKVVFLGDPRAGKRLIIDRLLNGGAFSPDFPEATPTGVDIFHTHYDLTGRPVTVHFWNFENSDSIHSMYRLFLTERTVYVLMVDAGAPFCQERCLQWLRTLKSFTETCPVLLALNNIEQNPKVAVNEDALREVYPELADIVFLSARHDSPERFCANFTHVLMRLIEVRLILNTMLPVSWLRLRRRLSEEQSIYISRQRFHALCNECGIDADPGERDSLLSWFHDLGICFHRSDTAEQSDYIILDPVWIAHAFAKILHDLGSQQQTRPVPIHIIRKCLAHADASRFRYSPGDTDYVLELMRACRFSFPVSGSLEFIPTLSSRTEPETAAEYCRDSGTYRFRMTYAYEPEDLLHQLMAELKEALDIVNTWRNGALFLLPDARALVECRGQSLDIHVKADSLSSVQAAFTAICDALERIRSDNHIQAGNLQIGHRQDGRLEWFGYDELAALVRDKHARLYSKTLNTTIPVSDIWIFSEGLETREQEHFAARVTTVCESIQNNSTLWGASAEHLSEYLRDSFSLQGYRVSDQTLAGETDGQPAMLQIHSAAGAPRAAGSVMYVRGPGKSQRINWDMQFEKLVKACMETPAPLVFTVTFAACTVEEFPGIREKYGRTFEFFNPDEYRILPEKPQILSAPPLIHAVRCVYSRAGTPVTAYHFLVRIGFDQFIARKMEQRRKMPNNEYKVVFLGDGDAGKSLTVGRLHEPERDPRSFDGQVTPGVDIRSRPYEVDGVDIQVNFWDFGGQAILHSMHRIFLSRRALYVVILNARNDSQDDRARFWLRYIDTYAPGAPVFLVLNKMDQNEHASLNEPLLRRQFPNISAFLRISALTLSQEEFRREFTIHLEDHIRSITVEESSFLKKEQTIRDTLRAWKDPRISMAEYETLCSGSGITDPAHQQSLMRKLENSGICVCFEGHSAMGQYRLLKPEWITKAMYSILFYKHSQARNGIISHEELRSLLNSVNTGYEADDVEFILQVMRFYRLSFEIPETGQEFLPMLCPRQEASELGAFLEEKDHLEFHMCFDYLPAEVLYQLMVARQRELELDRDSIWLTGAMLRDAEGCRAAVVREDHVLKFHISRSRDLIHARGYMDSLRHDMELIIRKNGLPRPETRVIYKYTYQNSGNVSYIEEPFDLDRLILSQDCGVLNTVSRELNAASGGQARTVAIRDILDQTYHSETVLHETLFRQLVEACRILQDNFDNHGKREPVLNRSLRDLLRAMGYRVMDQPESGASASWRGPGRPDLVVTFKDSASSVLIEPLRISGCGKADVRSWDAHLEKMVSNYNSSGYRMMVLVSYATASRTDFADIDRFYHHRMCSGGSTGIPERCGRVTETFIPDLIRVTRAEYYLKGYSPTIYHFLVYLPQAIRKPRRAARIRRFRHSTGTPHRKVLRKYAQPSQAQPLA